MPTAKFHCPKEFEEKNSLTVGDDGTVSMTSGLSASSRIYLICNFVKKEVAALNADEKWPSGSAVGRLASAFWDLNPEVKRFKDDLSFEHKEMSAKLHAEMGKIIGELMIFGFVENLRVNIEALTKASPEKKKETRIALVKEIGDFIRDLRVMDVMKSVRFMRNLKAEVEALKSNAPHDEQAQFDTPLADIGKSIDELDKPTGSQEVPGSFWAGWKAPCLCSAIFALTVLSIWRIKARKSPAAR